MRLTRARSLFAAGVIAVAGTATTAVLVAVPASAKPAAPASASSSQTVLVNCNNGVVKPKLFEPGCMASQEFFSKLSWTNWASNAFGSGTFDINSCDPSCANGKLQKLPVLVVAWKAQAWPNHSGKKFFSRLTVIFTGKLPKGTHATSTTLTLTPKQ